MSHGVRFTALLLLLFVLLPVGAARAACTAPSGNKAQIIYSSTAKTFHYCDDTNWIRMTEAGTGSGGCTNPTKTEGQMVFNDDHLVMQGCAGNQWKPLTRLRTHKQDSRTM